MKTVANLKDGVSGILTGLNLSNVSNLNRVFERAASIVSQRIDIPEAAGRQTITLYDHVYDNAAPSTIFGGAVVDFRPQGATRSELDEPYRQPIKEFDQTKALLPNGVSLTFEYRKGTPIFRASSVRTTPRSVLDGMTATTGWTAAGSASGLTTDQTVYYENGYSLRFTCTGSSTGTLTKTIGSQSMSEYQGVGVVFLALYTPSASALTSISLKIGSSASAYTTVSATQGYLGAWTAGDWTIVAFDLSTGSDTGTPNYAAIAYVQLSFAHTATLTNIRVGGLWASLPSLYELIFQSNAFFLVTGGSPSQTITDVSDNIILNDAAYTIYEHECARCVALQQGGSLGSGTIAILDRILEGTPQSPGLYDRYAADNPSQEIRTTSNYYE